MDLRESVSPCIIWHLQQSRQNEKRILRPTQSSLYYLHWMHSNYCRTTCTTRSSLGVLIHGEIPTCRADLDCMRRGLFCQSPCLSAGKISSKSRPVSDAIIGVNGCFCTPRSNHSRACGLVPLLCNRIPHNTRVHRSLR